MKNKSYLIIFILLFSNITFGQNVKVIEKNPNDLRLKYIEAIRFENQKQIRKAFENYQYLFNKMPEERLFYVKYFDLLFQLKKYDELERILPKTILDNPKNDNAKICLGKLFFIKDDTIKAFQTWDKYQKESNYSKIFTQHLFYTMLSLRLRDEAEDMLLKSRSINDDKILFSKDLANYYYSSGKYEKSISEYMKYLAKDDRNYNYISDRILQFPKDKNIFHSVDSVLIAHLNRNDDINIHKIRSEYLFRNNSYENAALEVLHIEKMTKYSGVNILNFCNDLIKIKEYGFAKKIYSKILKRKEFQNITTKILMGLARVQEQLILKDQNKSPLNYFLPGNEFFNTNFIYINDEKMKHLSQAFAIYDSLKTLKKGNNISGIAEFNIANLRYNYLRDFDGAIKNYDLAAKKSKSVRFRHSCFNKKFRSIISKGDLKLASKLLTKRNKQFQINFDKDYLVNLIMLDFLNMNFKKVLNHKESIIKVIGFEHPIFNDYFEVVNLIENNYTKKSKEEQKDFQRFVTAEFMIKQSKLNEAEGILDYIITNNPNSPIADESMFRLIQINLNINNLDKAETIADKLMRTDSNYRDSAAKMLGDFYFSHSINEKSKKWYQQILLDFPNSFYIEIARDKLRILRGDNL